MPPLPTVQPDTLSTLHRESIQTLDEPGLSWQSILAFSAILFAAMQGTLALESAAPCRLSRSKLKLFLALEFLELVVAIVAEVSSFLELQSAFQDRLRWLYWLPPCILSYGVFHLLVDVCYTLYVVYRSHVKWIPISSVGQHSNRLTCVIKLISLILSAALSFVLVGWRQRWWMRTSSFSSSEAAINATEGEVSLCVGVMVPCIIWAMLVLLFISFLFSFYRDELCDVAYYARLAKRTPERQGKRMLKALDNFKPETGSNFRDKLKWRNSKSNFGYRDSDENKDTVKDQWRLLHLILKTPVLDLQEDPQTGEKYIRICRKRNMEVNGPSSDETIDTSDHGRQTTADGQELFDDIDSIDRCVESCFGKEPLNVRNALLGRHKERLTQSEKAGVIETFLLIANHISLLPLLICVVVSVVRLWNRVDAESFKALKQLADVVIVVSAVEFAINLKKLLWGVRDADEAKMSTL